MAVRVSADGHQDRSPQWSRCPQRGRTGHEARNPKRFCPYHRIDMVVEDDAVETVFDCVAIA